MSSVLQFVSLLVFVFVSALLSSAHPWSKNDVGNVVVSRTITVDKSGKGDFVTVQQAVDSVPSMNKLWILIHVRAGIYREKVIIAKEKPFIVVEGEGEDKSLITFDNGGNVNTSTTFIVYADNFLARDISFKNSYNRVLAGGNHKVSWAPAAMVYGDKVSFVQCGFISLQDTLSDLAGRHFYDSCYVEGAMDFIWGNAQSFYKSCVLNVTTTALGGADAYITAQGRESATESTGFVFHSSTVIGTGPAFLGRAFRGFSRVVFFQSRMDDIIHPLGWNARSFVGQENLFTYVEERCSGPGANKSGRVKWEKRLPDKELQSLINVEQFINQDGWLQQLPSSHK